MITCLQVCASVVLAAQLSTLPCQTPTPFDHAGLAKSVTIGGDYAYVQLTACCVQVHTVPHACGSFTPGAQRMGAFSVCAGVY